MSSKFFASFCVGLFVVLSSLVLIHSIVHAQSEEEEDDDCKPGFPCMLVDQNGNIWYGILNEVNGEQHLSDARIYDSHGNLIGQGSSFCNGMCGPVTDPEPEPPPQQPPGGGGSGGGGGGGNPPGESVPVNPCENNPDCHGGGSGGNPPTCSGCQTVYASNQNSQTVPDICRMPLFDPAYCQNITYYCVDNNQMCPSGQSCNNGTCITQPPPCTGCQTWNGTACVDNNAYCTNGQTCSNGTCINPPPTKPSLVCNNANATKDNMACLGDSGCANTLSCIAGVCQNNACPGDADCDCATADPTDSPTPTPTLPPGFSVSANPESTNTVTVTWNTGSGQVGAVSTYIPEYKLSTSSIWTQSSSVNGSTFSTVITGLTPNTTYNFRVQANGSRGSSAYTGNIATATTLSTNPPVVTSRWVSGTVYSDAGNNNCEGGAAPLANVQIQVRNDADSSIVGNQTSNATGQYNSITATTPVNDAHILVNNIGSQVVKGVRDSNFAASFSQTYTSGIGYGFDWQANPSKTIDFCVGNSNLTSWFQTSVGDARYQTVTNPVPNRSFASNSTPASVFFSSLGQSTIQSGRVSPTNWYVNREYSEYNSVSTLGSTSYSFYLNQVSRAGITPTNVSTLPTTFLTGSSQGFYLKEGDLTINQNISVPAGNTVILLVNGNVDIRNPISVANNALFILAAKGSISIQPTVGNPFTEDNSATAALQGIYTAERNITILSNANCPTTSDDRLNVSGTLIANALRPFASNGSGKVINQRTLCANDSNYPSLKVYQRVSFVTSLSPLLKSQSRRWKE